MRFPVPEKARVWELEFLTLPRTRIPAIKQAGFCHLMAPQAAIVTGTNTVKPSILEFSFSHSDRCEGVGTQTICAACLHNTLGPG